MKTSPDKRFEIILHTTDDDSYFFSDTDYDWRVRSVETGDQLASFSGSISSGRGGTSRDGIATVRFSASGDAVEAVDVDGAVETVELPARIEIAPGGGSIALHYRDGRSETRERKAVVLTSKRGAPIRYELVDAPG